MHLVIVEKTLANGNVELTIKEGAEELKKAIAGKFVFPQKLVLTADQKLENKAGLRDILTGAFCIQDIPGATFTVINENGDEISDYKRSLYDGIGGGPGGQTGHC
jgi:hypothetical protein